MYHVHVHLGWDLLGLLDYLCGLISSKCVWKVGGLRERAAMLIDGCGDSSIPG